MSEEKNEKGKTYFGGLTFKQFKNVGKVPLELSDIEWAGRLIKTAPYWTTVLVKISVFCLSISVASLFLIWVSIFMRTPALLLGVYPDGQMVCFPRLVDQRGNVVEMDSEYQEMCQSLADRVGRQWDVSAFDAEPNQQAIQAQNQVQFNDLRQSP